MGTQVPSAPTVNSNRNIVQQVILPGALSFVISVIVVGVILCLLAGSWTYWRGWVFAFLFGLMNAQQVIYLGIKDPELLKRRKQVAPEGESTAQRIFIIVGLGSLVCLFIFSALDRRFGWSQVPVTISAIGNMLLVFSYFVYYLVFRINSYAASSIKTFEGQKVISVGPYGIVRHPKYVGDLFLLVSIPLALGSWWGLVFAVLSVTGLAWRILDEEKLLKKDLPGYDEYMQKVRYRLVPYIW
jgi:protein-S-isoprenylcysteine O-methyltransferase Ste14